MRNPWRFCFDPVTGELYVGQVGESLYESAFIVGKRDNCGWNYYEGNVPYTGTPPSGFVPKQPLVEYGHTNGRVCIISGIVARNTRWSALNGAYLYADFGSC